jgi:hypothetical protein
VQRQRIDFIEKRSCDALHGLVKKENQMPPVRRFSVILMLLVLISSSACGSSTPQAVDFTKVTPEVVVQLPTAAPTEPFVVPVEDLPTGTPAPKDFEDFNASNFDQSATIDNPWLPLTPGTQLIYEGDTEDNGVMVPHRLVITVTDLTKVINGVRSVITWDQDFKAGAMVESELAFYAQDKNGNVWRMGEHPEEYQDGQYVDAPTWFAGIKSSVAGIEMLGNPQVGTPSYSQGWAPSVEFSDRGQVSQVGQQVCVPAACYNDVLVIDETSRAEPGAHQLKLFARGVGNIKVDWRGADKTQEILELTQIVHITPEQMAAVHTSALEEEKHAYLVSKEVYGQTLPSE